MPLQNRVTPEGEIVAVPQRGTFLGNRGGCFHKPDQTLGTSRWKSRAWITCLLAFKNRRRKLMQPGLYTELFFLDEVTALAAGHRPCFECRRTDAKDFFAAWYASGLARPVKRANELDAVLHDERVGNGREKKTHRARLGSLPTGAMALIDGDAFALAGNRLLKWSHDGYTSVAPYNENDAVEVLTPATTVQILRSGYRPHIHPSATALAPDHGLRQSQEN